jgi:hypothetical protein
MGTDDRKLYSFIQDCFFLASSVGKNIPSCGSRTNYYDSRSQASSSSFDMARSI